MRYDQARVWLHTGFPLYADYPDGEENRRMRVIRLTHHTNDEVTLIGINGENVRRRLSHVEFSTC